MHVYCEKRYKSRFRFVIYDSELNINQAIGNTNIQDELKCHDHLTDWIRHFSNKIPLKSELEPTSSHRNMKEG